MKLLFKAPQGAGQISLIAQESVLDRYFKEKSLDNSLYTIAWNLGPAQQVYIDEVAYPFAAQAVLPIMMSQSFRFDQPESIVMWQFNREFYCIVNHDAEVGCVGFVFYGPSPTMFISLVPEAQTAMDQLYGQFIKEFNTNEDIKGEMLRILLVRLIILITREAKKQYLGTDAPFDKGYNLVRQFNLLVEIHYRQAHQVQFYAQLLHKSPKTISHVFSRYSNKTPLQVIQDRIMAEAKRLFYYTDKSVKEVAEELGFHEVAHFSKFFKNQAAQNPSDLKKKLPPKA